MAKWSQVCLCYGSVLAMPFFSQQHKPVIFKAPDICRRCVEDSPAFSGRNNKAFKNGQKLGKKKFYMFLG